MAARSDQIEKHIRSTRNDLGRNLEELEGRVKSATDWRARFQENPMTMLTVAFGAGWLLSTLAGGHKRSHSSSQSSPAVERAKSKASDAWENVKGALIGLAATRARTYLGEAIPGFHDEYARAERENTASRPGNQYEPAGTRM